MSANPRLDLSLTQVLASALAAVTATVAASYFGVTGTVIGAALASVLTVTGNAVYGHSLRRTGDRVRDVVPARVRRLPPGAAPYSEPVAMPVAKPVAMPVAEPVAEPGVTPAKAGRPTLSAATWRRMAFTAAGVFAAVLAVITGIELVTGKPVSTIVRGDAGSGTTVFGTAPRSSTPATPAPTVTRTVTPSVVVVTPTVTRTAAPTTRTATPTVTATPTPTASSTPASTAAPSGTTATAPAVP